MNSGRHSIYITDRGVQKGWVPECFTNSVTLLGEAITHGLGYLDHPLRLHGPGTSTSTFYSRVRCQPVLET